DKREDFIEHAMKNIKTANLEEFVETKLKDITTGIDEENLDAIILDMPNPWDAINYAYKALKVGGYLCTYSPLSTQVEKTVEEIKKHGFIEVKTIENIQREIIVSENGIRPSFDMLGHTGYLTFARKIL
ncbi:MAG: tRNA (adenine-N1)-methyltransferase, partial [Candidatus Thermoplasmatota archaeon]|nr:tRNA (adenine-N1)-methyltransferase [Candidatus Thermoplasmatota archaeon]